MSYFDNSVAYSVIQMIELGVVSVIYRSIERDIFCGTITTIESAYANCNELEQLKNKPRHHPSLEYRHHIEDKTTS